MPETPKDQKEAMSPAQNRELKVLDFWREKDIFKKSLTKDAPKGEFVFYDGPPFATGKPHFGHILAGTMKDVIPRYRTMRGYHVARRWGWDCHGLPIENIVEKEIGLKSKKDIVDYGIDKFNHAAREAVLRYADVWREQVPRFGRWVDMDDDYRTMDASYTESVWWVFKRLHDKGLIYEGFKSMQLCPRCETTLSNFEVTQGYKDVTDISVYAKFPLVDAPDTSFIAWTTTPWTLPGNVALAVGADIVYVKVKVAETSFYILAKEKVATVLKDQPYEIVAEMKGSELVTKSYQAPFPYYVADTKLKNRENAWKVYVADFVTLEKGTGIVHIAPAFGEDDYVLSQKESLPFVQHVATNGTFKKEVTDFAGQLVKSKDDPQKADVEVIKYLAHKGLLFAKEKIVHSYAHCWRCETPLLNYASSSWFVKVTDFKDRLVAENKKVQWVPEDIKEGRFGNWLENARDWAISRSRFWGAPIPVWKCGQCEKVSPIGSIADLKKGVKRRNTYYVMRHGEAEHNVQRVMSTVLSDKHHLTEKGKQQALTAGQFLKDKNIEVIFASPFLRTQETMQEVCQVIGFDHKKIVKDPRIGELKAGVFEGKPVEQYHSFFGPQGDRFVMAPEGAETYTDIKKRVGDFIYDVDQRYEGKNILIVTHDSPAWLLFAAVNGLSSHQANAFRGTEEFFLKNAEVRALDFVPLPHNSQYEIDPHRPYIDEVVLTCSCGGKMKRVPEVFDCWFESGAMPYGEAHYPFENLETFNPHPQFLARLLGKTKGYPAQFIAEGLDQTRGWFYSMLVLGVALFDKSPYEQVIVNGLILAEDGRKMSKSLNNYPDPMGVVNKYGADALRFYLLNSPVVRSQDMCFSERGVDEVAKKLIGRLDNVRAFYALYAEGTVVASDTSSNILDQWMLARLSEVKNEMTEAFDKYELDRACRPLNLFVDDLSTWYLRRSRDRFKGDDVVDKQYALQTTRYVLRETAKIIAPIMPFYAESLYQFLRESVGATDIPAESVHLDTWTDAKDLKQKQQAIIAEMATVRMLVSLGLEARMKAKINVRQPLARMSVKNLPPNISGELLTLISDEVNVKTVVTDSTLAEEVSLDTAITPQLKEEGQIRDIIRSVQELRKQGGLDPRDLITLVVDTDEAGKKFVLKYETEISKVTGVKKVTWGIVQQGAHLDFGELKFGLKIEGGIK